MRLKNSIILLMICSISLLLASCGFHLRGTSNLPPQLHTMYVTSTTPYSPLIRDLKTSLKFSNVNLVNAPELAPVTLDVTTDNASYTQTSIGNSQETRDYSVTYSVQYVLKNAKGKVLYTPSPISVQKTITLNAQEVVTNSNKYSDATEDMRRDIIERIMFQLSAKNTLAALGS